MFEHLCMDLGYEAGGVRGGLERPWANKNEKLYREFYSKLYRNFDIF